MINITQLCAFATSWTCLNWLWLTSKRRSFAIHDQSFMQSKQPGTAMSILVRVDYKSYNRQKKFLEFPAVLRCTAYTQ